MKKLKDLEREKDLLWMGLQALEQVREKLCSNLDNDMEVQDKVRKGEMKKVSFGYQLFIFYFFYTYLLILFV